MEIDKKESLIAIKSLYSEIPNLQKSTEDDEKFQIWKHQVDNTIRFIFGDNSPQHKSIHNCLFPIPMGITRKTREDYHKSYLNRLDSLYKQLIGLEAALKPFCKNNINEKENDAIETLTHILSRFHKFARQLRNRHDKREPIEIKDEYDVQDLLHAILKLHFDDVRPEENRPSHAGSSSRVDFALKKEQILIEVKKTRNNLRDKELGKQLTLDIAQYKALPDYKTLICFIYDPEGLIENPSGLKEDLSETNSEMDIVVVIAPQS